MKKTEKEIKYIYSFSKASKRFPKGWESCIREEIIYPRKLSKNEIEEANTEFIGEMIDGKKKYTSKYLFQVFGRANKHVKGRK